MKKKNKFPLISIITISQNNAVGLEKTIQSVINQTYEKIEYIVIDGDSSDNTVDIIKRFEKHITFWVSEPDTGIYNAMNKGIKRSNGDYVMFLNSGDIFFENQSVEKIVSKAGNFDIIYNNLNIVGHKKSYIKKYTEELSFHYFTYESLPHPATLIKKNLFDKIGLYDETLKITSDWKWFINALCKYNVSYKNSGETAAYFYLDGISSSSKYTELIKKEKQQVLNEDYPLFIKCSKKLNRIKLHNLISSLVDYIKIHF